MMYKRIISRHDQWFRPIIPMLMRQENQEFRTSFSYVEVSRPAWAILDLVSKTKVKP